MGLPGRAARIHSVASLDEVDWTGVSLVIECVPERVDIKQALFAELEHRAERDTVLTSNSSSFPISAIAQGLSTADRMFGLHFFMPAHLVPLVEVVLGGRSDPALGTQAVAVATGLSARYINKLFEQEDSSLMRYILRRRLHGCMRDLKDPAQAQRTLKTLAMAVAFVGMMFVPQAFAQEFGGTEPRTGSETTLVEATGSIVSASPPEITRSTTTVGL